MVWAETHSRGSSGGLFPWYKYNFLTPAETPPFSNPLNAGNKEEAPVIPKFCFYLTTNLIPHTSSVGLFPQTQHPCFWPHRVMNDNVTSLFQNVPLCVGYRDVALAVIRLDSSHPVKLQIQKAYRLQRSVSQLLIKSWISLDLYFRSCTSDLKTFRGSVSFCHKEESPQGFWPKRPGWQPSCTSPWHPLRTLVKIKVRKSREQWIIKF